MTTISTVLYYVLILLAVPGFIVYFLMLWNFAMLGYFYWNEAKEEWARK